LHVSWFLQNSIHVSIIPICVSFASAQSAEQLLAIGRDAVRIPIFAQSSTRIFEACE